MELILKSKLLAFVESYNKDYDHDFEVEFEDDGIRIVTPSIFSEVFLSLFMEFESENHFCFYITERRGYPTIYCY